MKRIFLVRHGQSEGNLNPSLYFEKFDCDIGLTEQGRLDSIRAATTIMDISDAIHSQRTTPESEPVRFEVFHSSYLRAKETANHMVGQMMAFDGYSVEEIHETPLLREREWGGLRDILTRGMKTESHFNFYYRPDGGESFADAYLRAVAFYQWFLSTSKYENNIIVAHGEFNKLLLMHLLEWPMTDFEKWKNPKNGEVFLLNDRQLSPRTPLTPKTRKV